MKIRHKPVMRRTFLKMGLTGGTILSLLPLKRFILASFLPPDTSSRSDSEFSEESLEKLVELNREYGGEFGEVEV